MKKITYGSKTAWQTTKSDSDISKSTHRDVFQLAWRSFLFFVPQRVVIQVPALIIHGTTLPLNINTFCHCTLDIYKRLKHHSTLCWWHHILIYAGTTIFVQYESKNFIPLGFLNFFSQRLRIFKQNFTRLLYVYIYTKSQNFIQLSLNLTVMPY